MNKLPCIDCITLATCRLYYLKELERSEGTANFGYHGLRDKCSLLNDYFKDNSKVSHVQYAICYRTMVKYIEEGEIYLGEVTL